MLSADCSLKCVKGEDNIIFSRLRSPDLIEEDALLFIKNTMFLNKLKNNLKGQKIHLITPESFFKKFQEEVSAIAESVFVTPNIELSIPRVSKVFYDELFAGINHSVDGRQMGTAYVHPSTTIAQHVFLGEGVHIGKNCVIHPHVTIMAGAKIGDYSELFPNVVIYPNVITGNHVRIHAHTSVGQDGFGYTHIDDIHHKIWHTGSVVVEDYVEIGSGTCIDGGTFSPTIIGERTKIDNQVQIGHNCHLGKGVIICGQVGIGGSTKIGDFTFVGGKVGIANGLTLGSRCQVAGAAMATSDWPDGSIIGGHPARNLSEWMKGVAYIRKQSAAKKKAL